MSKIQTPWEVIAKVEQLVVVLKGTRGNVGNVEKALTAAFLSAGEYNVVEASSGVVRGQPEIIERVFVGLMNPGLDLVHLSAVERGGGEGHQSGEEHDELHVCCCSRVYRTCEDGKLEEWPHLYVPELLVVV